MNCDGRGDWDIGSPLWQALQGLGRGGPHPSVGRLRLALVGSVPLLSYELALYPWAFSQPCWKLHPILSLLVILIHLKVKNQNRTWDLKICSCGRQLLMAPVPLVAAIGSFWSLWSQQGWREKAWCCSFRKKHASAPFAAGVLMTES